MDIEVIVIFLFIFILSLVVASVYCSFKDYEEKENDN